MSICGYVGDNLIECQLTHVKWVATNSKLKQYWCSIYTNVYLTVDNPGQYFPKSYYKCKATVSTSQYNIISRIPSHIKAEKRENCTWPLAMHGLDNHRGILSAINSLFTHFVTSWMLFHINDHTIDEKNLHFTSPAWNKNVVM